MQIKIGHLSTSTQNSTVIDESKSSLLLFDIVLTTFIPGKIGVEVPLPNLGRFTVIFKLTRRRDIGEGGVGEGRIRRESITQDEIGEGGFDGIYFCGFFPKLRFFAYFLHISLILPERSSRAAMGWEGAHSVLFRA
jgi:hypothetical protein